MMKKTTVVSCLALALLYAFAGGIASAGESGDVAKPIEENYDRIFAEQDKALNEAKAFEEKREYDKAIQWISEKVFLPLQKMKEERNSWKVQQRCRSVGSKLEQLRRKSGEQKLNQAKEAFAAENYAESVEFAVAAAEVCPELKSKADFWKETALRRKKNAQRAKDMAAKTADPMLDQNDKTIVRELEIARTLIKNKRYEDARRHIEEVYKINPFNAEAAYLAGEIYRKFYQAGYQRRKADIEGMKAVEAWQWVEPAFLRDKGSSDVPEGTIEGASDQGINAKMDKIIFAKVRWDETEILAVVDYLNRYSKNNDPDKEGVIIDYDAGAQKKTSKKNTDGSRQPGIPLNTPGLEGGNPLPQMGDPAPGGTPDNENAVNSAKGEIQVTLSVDNVSLREILDYISFLTELHYTVLPDRIVLGNGGNELISSRFEITPDAVNRIANFSGDTGTAADDSQDEAAPPAGPHVEADVAPGVGGDAGPGGGNTDGALTAGKATLPPIKPATLKKFFGIYGVDFNTPRSSITYNRKGKLLVTNTPENITKLNDVLRLINTPKPMVRVEIKSIEISDQDMQQLGFEWSLKTLQQSNGGSQSTTASVGTNAVTGAANAMLRGATSMVDSKLISNLDIFPDLLGSLKPFGSDNELNLSLTIDALDRSDRTETISAPTVTVSDGMTGEVFLGKSYYFPESWDTMEVEMDSGVQSSSWGLRVTRPTPEFGETTDIGTNFTVTPNVKNDNYTIALAVHPKIVAYLGPESYVMTVWYQNTADEEKYIFGDFYVWRPILSYRELDLKVNVYDGETLVLGALADSKAASRLDKIPILGDLPLVGRLFQSHSETSERKNMLIFVTARLVNDAGLPIRRLEHSGGAIPEANR